MNFTIQLGLLLEDEQLIQKLAVQFPTLPKILQKNNINVNNLKLLSKRGDHGLAFSDGQVVVKITDDKTEARAAANLVGKKLKGTNEIYHVGTFAQQLPYHDPQVAKELDIKGTYQYYLIIQELVDTNVSWQEEQVAHFIGDWLMANQEWPFNPDEALEDIKKIFSIESGEPEFLEDPKNQQIALDLLTNVAELFKHGVKYLDVGAGNIGHNKSGRLVLFDLGVSESKPGRLSKIESKEIKIPIIS